MKRTFLSIVLTLALIMGLCVSAFAAATYVPDNVTYQNIDGKQLAIKVYTLLPDQDPSALMEPDFDFDDYHYSYSSMVKEEMTFKDESEHKEVVTITTSSKNLEDILAQLEPTIDYSDGTASGVLALDHNSIKTEAAGYTNYSYTVTATKNYSGLDRNDSSYIERTVVKDGRTLSLSNVTWAVESTALVGEDLVPATYCAVATYSGTGYGSKATGYVSTAEYRGTVTASGISSIRYTVTYLGTKIAAAEPVVRELEPEPQRSVLPLVFGLLILLSALGGLFFYLLTRKNITVYKATGNGNEYDKCGTLSLSVRRPELRIDRLRNVPEGMIAVEVEERTARSLFGKNISVLYYGKTLTHTVGAVNGPYWFTMDLGSAPVQPQPPHGGMPAAKQMAAMCLALCLAFTCAVNAYATDYTFGGSDDDDDDYYGSTNYEDQYGSQYNYGGRNQCDYDIPEIQYGLAQEFLETSLDSPYVDPNVHYGLSDGTAGGGTVSYPGDEPSTQTSQTTQPLTITYRETITAADLTQKDGSLGEVAIERVGLHAKVYEDTTSASMAKGAGHFLSSAYWQGNVALFGHNRGRSCAYFAQLKDVKIGDTVTYKTCLGTKTYKVNYVGTITYTDYTPLSEMGDNRITLITCIADQPTLRLCVQAVECN